MFETMLDYIRIVLYTLLLVLGFFAYQSWNKDHPLMSTGSQAAIKIDSSSNENVPNAAVAALNSQNGTATEMPAVSLAAPVRQTISVQTDVLDVTIDKHGGDIIESKLLKFPAQLHSESPFVLLNDAASTRYIAESGLLSQNGPDTKASQATYSAAQTHYQLQPDANELAVQLEWQNAAGIKVNKVYTFTRGNYQIKVNYRINNQSSADWVGNLYTQLMRTDSPPKSTGGLVNLATYFGAAISTPEKLFEKISFKDMREKNLNRSAQGGWISMLQHYFISAWVPAKNTTSTYYSQVSPSGIYTIGMVGQPLRAAPGASVATEATLYTGPTIASDLEKVSPNLKLTIDYGWFWFISGIIFWLMQKIYDVVGNWGWSIVLVTIFIKILFYQLSAKSYRSMSAMKKMQPRIEALKQRFGDDRQKLTQATLELYRKEKVNPMSGCLPVLIQIPVFIALYWVLVESVQLRQAPFILWIHDLSQSDPYYILPVMMGISMFLQQRLNPPPPDPMQAKIMMLMPIIFTVLFANFPAGLMLYWFVNNTLSFLQQWHIMHRVNQTKTSKQIKA